MNTKSKLESDSLFYKLIDILANYRANLKLLTLKEQTYQDFENEVESISIDVDNLIKTYKDYKNGLVSYSQLRNIINSL